jgi:hypothetical protein
MKICWTIVALSLLALSGTSLADYLIGKASVIESCASETCEPHTVFRLNHQKKAGDAPLP